MILSSMAYCTLHQALDAGSDSVPTAGSSAETVFHDRLTKFIVRASREIDQHKHFAFAPSIATEYYGANSGRVNAFEIFLGYPMMALTSVTLADSSSLTLNTHCRGWPRSNSPILTIQALTSTVDFRVNSGTLDNDITVVGIWGWHNDYSNAWIDSGDAISTTALTADATDTTVKVTDADGTSGTGFSPRFSPGNLIKIDDEFMAVIDTDTSSTPNTLTVVRAERGSTLAAHDIAATIYIFIPEPAITRALMVWVEYQYGRRNQTSRMAFEGAQAQTPNWEMPPEVKDILDSYQILEVSG